MTLRDEMQRLIEWVWKRANEKGYDIDDHHTLYHETAAEFDLYDSGPVGDPAAPVWLSRIVAGVLQDRAEGLPFKDGVQ